MSKQTKNIITKNVHTFRTQALLMFTISLGVFSFYFTDFRFP